MSQEPELSDQDEGVFATYEEQEASAEKREAEQRMSHDDLAEYARSANARAREMAAENLELRRRLGIEPGAPLGGGPEPEIASRSSYRGNVDDNTYSAGRAGELNDLVPGRGSDGLYGISPDELRDLVREVVREQLPRPRAIQVHIPNEGMARVDALEVVSKLFPSLVLVVAQLASRAMRVAEDDALWSMGVPDETAAQMNQVARAVARRPKEVNRSRSM
jgi:hypothetical protein